MNTLFEILGDNEEDNRRIYKIASDILKAGGLVAFPTETVYGLGGNALDMKASEKIYGAKGRPSDNPLIVHIANIDALKVLCVDVPQIAYDMAEKFWPGPMTMILKKSDIVPRATTGGLDTVAIRMPNHKVALELIEKSGVYIAGPSANLSGRPSPTKAAHVKQDLDGRIDMIIDGGDGSIGIESSIIDLTGENPTILRPGYITKEMFEEVAGKGNVEIDQAILPGHTTSKPPKAPGMKYRHYAPKGQMVILESENEDKLVARINEMAAESMAGGLKTGILGTDKTMCKYKADVVLSTGDRNDVVSISSHLYDVLRKFDDEEVQYIISESFSNQGIGYAIMNRLLKAAGGKKICIDESEEV